MRLLLLSDGPILINPSLPQPVKFPGWKLHGCACKHCIFRSCNIDFQCYILMTILSHASAKKERKKEKKSTKKKKQKGLTLLLPENVPLIQSLESRVSRRDSAIPKHSFFPPSCFYLAYTVSTEPEVQRVVLWVWHLTGKYERCHQGRRVMSQGQWKG